MAHVSMYILMALVTYQIYRHYCLVPVRGGKVSVPSRLVKPIRSHIQRAHTLLPSREDTTPPHPTRSLRSSPIALPPPAPLCLNPPPLASASPP
jgi:hypothetical protein